MAQGNQNKGINVLFPAYTLFDIGVYIYTQKTYGRATFSGGLQLDSLFFKERGRPRPGVDRVSPKLCFAVKCITPSTL